MCGRCACSLNPETLRRVCGYKNASGKYEETQWVESESKYVPCSNIGPRDVLACVVAGQHFRRREERVLCSMMWGIIPPWCEGDYRKHKMSTHNARIENIQHSRLYSPALNKGQRCVVLCEGFYEWKANESKSSPKQPYYIYATQEDGVAVDEEWSEESGWKGLKPMKMAGLFDAFKTADGKLVHSCTIITKDADDFLSWLHHRSPVILATDEDVKVWLDKAVSPREALERLRESRLSKDALRWHTVSTAVNSVTNKSVDCTKEVNNAEGKKGRHGGFMASWLKTGNAAKRKSPDTAEASGRAPKVSKKE